jgi:hypothetical protein
MVARYLSCRPGREQAGPAWCTQGFSAPHCERLARSITVWWSSQVPCRDRRQGASRLYIKGVATCFWCSVSRSWWVGACEHAVAACRVSRFGISVPAGSTLRARLPRLRGGMALQSMPNAMKQLHRNAPIWPPHPTRLPVLVLVLLCCRTLLLLLLCWWWWWSCAWRRREKGASSMNGHFASGRDRPVLSLPQTPCAGAAEAAVCAGLRG